MAYFLYRIARGARVFEHASLLELRFCPYLRTDPSADEEVRIAQMEPVLEAVAQAAKQPEFAVDIRLLLCLHSALSDSVNQAIVDLALHRRDLVRGIDIAGPENRVAERVTHFADCLRRVTNAASACHSACRGDAPAVYPSGVISLSPAHWAWRANPAVSSRLVG